MNELTTIQTGIVPAADMADLITRFVDYISVKSVTMESYSVCLRCFMVPLPTRVERYTVNRSPNVDKKSMDQFEMRTHKRLLDIVNPTAKTIDELKKLNLPAGVDITIKV